ncbi:MAG: RsmD family RNA methyltransferase [Planctomycetota bacterium]
MSLRIIGGEFGGRALKSVRGMGTRPLLGQVRESLFNILGDRVEGAFVWDLFAGSGGSGLEALSRGAARVLFVEKSGRVVDVLRNNLRALGDVEGRGVVMRGDAWDPPLMHRPVFGADRVAAVGADAGDDGDAGPAAASDVEVAPDVIFLDPPYSMVAEDPVKSLARARRLLDRTAPGGCVLFHFESGVLDEDDFDGDLEVDLREWGSSVVAIMWREGEAPAASKKRAKKAKVTKKKTKAAKGSAKSKSGKAKAAKAETSKAETERVVASEIEADDAELVHVPESASVPEQGDQLASDAVESGAPESGEVTEPEAKKAPAKKKAAKKKVAKKPAAKKKAVKKAAKKTAKKAVKKVVKKAAKKKAAVRVEDGDKLDDKPSES